MLLDDISHEKSYTTKSKLVHRRPKLTSREKPTINSWTRHALCDSVLSYDFSKDEMIDRINSDGKASLKRKKSPETTTDTQDVSKCYWFYV